MDYVNRVKAAVAAAACAAVLALSGCNSSCYCVKGMYDSNNNCIGFRAKKGREVYQLLRREGTVYIEKAKVSGEHFEWVPVGKREFEGPLEEAFEKVEEGEQRVSLSAILQ
jgi:hypothetical protein